MRLQWQRCIARMPTGAIMRSVHGWLLAAMLAALAVLACAGAAAAGGSPALVETPRLRMYGVADGLPSSSVNAIAQDAQGYLWLGTDDGLARFDGVGFKVWRHDPADSASLPGNLVQALHVDARGRVWVAMEGHGMALLLPDGVHFRRYDHDTTPGLGEDDVFAIDSTPDGALWIGTYGGGLYRLDVRNVLTHFQPRADDPHSLPDANVLALSVDAQGQPWVGTTLGAARWNGRGFDTVDAPGVHGAMVFAIFPQADGSVLFGTSAGLYLRQVDGRVLALHWNADPANPRITGILRDRDGGWWLSAPGLLRRRAWALDDAQPAQPVQLPGTSTQRVMALLQDREGSVWFGVRNGGLAQLAPQALHLATFRHDAEHPASLSAIQPEGIAATDHGRLWVVGGGSAIDRIDPATGAIDHWQPPELAHKYLWSVNQRDDGPLWIGYNIGIARADPQTHRVQVWEQGRGHDAPLAGPNDLIALTPDGRVWTSSLGAGIQARDGEGRVLIAIRPGDGHGLDAADTEQLGLSPQGALWLAGAQGLLAWNEAAQRFVPIPGAPADRVYGFAFSDAHTLWLHRASALERYSWDGHGLTPGVSVGTRQGLPAVESGGVIADAGGDVWLTTTRGLVRWDVRSQRVRMYGVRDGLPSQEFGRHPPLLTAHGIAAAGAVDGLVLFQPSALPLANAPPPLAIDAIQVRRGDGQFAFNPLGPIVLQPGDRDLRVRARLLSYLDPGANRYRMRLQGFESSWTELGAAGERTLSRIDPGHYTLEVQAVDADGAWATPREIAVTVTPPWWQTRLAYLAGVFAFTLLLWLLAWLYRRRLQQRHTLALAEQRRVLAEQNSAAKSRFLATMGHEIRTPMTGVLGMAELLLGSPLDPGRRAQVQAIDRAGRHLLRIVNDALDLARIEAGKLALEVAPFAPRALLSEADALLRPLADDKQLAFDTHVVADVPAGLRGDAGRIRQIVLNLGSNAIKFTRHGNVRIVFSWNADDGRLRITVTDSGPGMDTKQVARLFERFEQGEGAQAATTNGSSGLGLAICRELAAAMAGSIEVQSTPGVGARFDVVLPLLPAELPVSASPRAVPMAARPNAQTLHLLLVEDDAIVADVIAGLLRVAGHGVTHAAHGLAALSELDNAHFDAALLDLDLPGMHGVELARLIRARGMAVPLIAITARADANAEAEVRAAGMDGFLRKPVTGELLAVAIESACAAREALHAHGYATERNAGTGME